MRSLIITSITLLSSFFNLSFASRLKELLLFKYREHLVDRAIEFEIFFDANGEEILIPNLPLLTFERTTFQNPDNLELLDAFEENPEAVCNSRYVGSYSFLHVVRDYHNDDTSKEIIEYYDEIGIGPNLVGVLVYHAFYYNVPEVVEIFIDQIAAIVASGKQASHRGRPWIEAVFQSGSFKILEHLIERGIYIVPVKSMIYLLCTRFYPENLEKALDFLDYLLRARLEIELNVPLTGERLTPLIICLQVLTIPRPMLTDYQRAIANRLIQYGADPLLVGPNDLNAHQLAALQGVILTVLS